MISNITSNVTNITAIINNVVTENVSNVTSTAVAKTDLLHGLIVPVIQLLFYVCFFGGLAFIITRAVLKLWKQNYKWLLKYHLPFRKQEYKKEDLEWIVEQSKSMDLSQIKMKMLINDYSEDRINEIIFIYNDIEKQSGGALKNQRKIDGNNREVEEKELPKIEGGKKDGKEEN